MSQKAFHTLTIDKSYSLSTLVSRVQLGVTGRILDCTTLK